MEEVLIILTIYLLCTLKTIFGPVMGYTAGLSPIFTILITVSGMMTTVLIFTLFGEKIRTKILKKYIKPRKIFTPKNRRFVRIWSRYGELGISFLTPILLSPPGGSIIAIALGGTRKKTIGYMFLWSVVWSTILTYGIYYSGDTVKDFFGV